MSVNVVRGVPATVPTSDLDALDVHAHAMPLPLLQRLADRGLADLAGYELTDDERKAFENRDIAAFYNLGLHEVLLNRFCRAAGFARDDYRKILEPFGQKEERRARWQR